MIIQVYAYEDWFRLRNVNWNHLVKEHCLYHKNKTNIQRFATIESLLPSIVSIREKLSHDLLNLDIDEGLRIESTKNRKKVFINKRTSGCYVLQIYSDITNVSEFKFYRNINHIHTLIDNIFGKEYYVSLYWITIDLFSKYIRLIVETPDQDSDNI